MTEAQIKLFNEWFDEYADKNDIRLAINYGAYEIAWDAWQHQQQRIDELEEENSELKFQCASNDLHAATLLERIEELESKLKIAVDALRSCQILEYTQRRKEEGYAPFVEKKLRKTFDAEKVESALKQIEVK